MDSAAPPRRPLRRVSRGQREAELARRNFFAWSELDPDLLMCVASALDHRSLLRFLQVCTAWLKAVGSDDSQNRLWEPLVLEAYPRAAKLLVLAPPPCIDYKRVFHDQWVAEGPSTGRVRAKPTCALSDFVFTFEFIREPKSPFKAGDKVVFIESHEEADMSNAPDPRHGLLDFAKGTTSRWLRPA